MPQTLTLSANDVETSTNAWSFNTLNVGTTMSGMCTVIELEVKSFSFSQPMNAKKGLVSGFEYVGVYCLCTVIENPFWVIFEIDMNKNSFLST